MAHRLKPNREQRGRDLLASRDEHVSLARIGRLAQFGGEAKQPVGLARHRGHDDDQANRHYRALCRRDRRRT